MATPKPASHNYIYCLSSWRALPNFPTRGPFIGGQGSLTAREAFCFILDVRFKSFESYTIKLSAKEIKLTD